MSKLQKFLPTVHWCDFELLAMFFFLIFFYLFSSVQFNSISSVIANFVFSSAFACCTGGAYIWATSFCVSHSCEFHCNCGSNNIWNSLVVYCAITWIVEAILLFLQAKFWKQYVEAYMAVNNDDATKQLFSRCLLICLQVPLWYCFPFYIIVALFHQFSFLISCLWNNFI